MATVFLILTAMVSGIFGLAPCDLGLVGKFKTVKDCYTNGKPPASLTAIGVPGTHVQISKGELPPQVKCVKAVQHAGSADVTFYADEGTKVLGSYTMIHKPVPAEGYILETDSKGNKFRLYVIHNEAKVYSYYRCIESTTDKTLDTKTPMGDIAVACQKDPQSDAVINRAKSCFSQVKISNLVPLTPCKC